MSGARDLVLSCGQNLGRITMENNRPVCRHEMKRYATLCKVCGAKKGEKIACATHIKAASLHCCDAAGVPRQLPSLMSCIKNGAP